MMDFDNILDIASQNQGHGSAQQKRYSLQVGPPKKDPRSKGVNPAAVEALLKKQNHEIKKKETQFRQQKDELAAKRIELKSDRKARAMASRTKDNFRGYNGVPVLEVPKKRRTKLEMQEEASLRNHAFRNQSIDPEDDEYETDSETEQEPEPLRPGRLCSKKASGPPKAPPAMYYADLLKLAEKKQFEPVDVKPKAVRKEERLRTADEIRELEMERNAKRPGKDRDSNAQRERDGKSQSRSTGGSGRKGTLERKPKNRSEKPGVPSGSEKKPQQKPVSGRSHSSSKPAVGGRDGERWRTSQSDGDRRKARTSTCGSVKATPSQVPPPSHRLTTSDLRLKKEMSSLRLGRPSGVPGTRPVPAAVQRSQPSQARSMKQEPRRPGVTAAERSDGPQKAGRRPRPGPGPKSAVPAGGTPQARPAGRGVQGGPRPPGMRPGQPARGGTGSGPGRPKCTVVSETISSKNVGGPRTGAPPQTGRPPGTTLPPITSAYKRTYEDEDEEYDSEMDDFIDDGAEEQEEISRHIKEIFGYDRTKYKNESEYALKFMESSWKEMQKEEARSLKMAVQEDLEEEKREAEELKTTAKRRKMN
ncbi:protein SPT2 homolog [Brachionichthys hirsutus]|uniref:protein SPT2 homolog n=1 Tax=Brachionichthys hirsutus TaxID=412623 RepID=UPI00360517A4